jgi:hypothetical protein
MNIFRVYENNGRVYQLAREDTDSWLDEKLISGTDSPGLGHHKVDTINIPVSEIRAGDQLTVQAHILGENIAFIYIEMLLKDPQQELYYGPVVRVPVKSLQEGDVDGQVYPVWEDNILVDLSITPGMRMVTDGTNSALAFTQPAGYGLEEDYLDGLLIRKKTDTKMKARLFFSPDGQLSKMMVFKNRKGHLIPHTLKLAEGDQFHPQIQVFGKNDRDGVVREIGSCYSTPITYQGIPVKLASETPIPGEYYFCLVIEDLGGRSSRLGQTIKLVA